MTLLTVPEALARELRRDGSRPWLTFYDDATGERVELSVTSTANWVAKTASLLVDELDVERGDEVRVDLPTHWLTPVWLLACWAVGAACRLGPGSEPTAVVVSGPTGIPTYAEGPGTLVALSLRPLGGRFTEPLPPGVLDFAEVVPGQPDSFVALDPPAGTDPAVVGEPRPWTQAELLAGADAPAGERLLTDAHPASHQGLAAVAASLVHGGSTVWVAHPDPSGWEHRAEQERATRVLRTEG